MFVFHVIGDSLSWNKEQILGDVVAASGDHAQRDPRENVRVVPLAGLVNFPSVMHVAERRTGRKYTFPLQVSSAGLLN